MTFDDLIGRQLALATASYKDAGSSALGRSTRVIPCLQSSSRGDEVDERRIVRDAHL